MSIINENVLSPISIRLLYEGMVVEDDIYDADCERLLMKAGNTLTSDQIERMYRINNGRDVIYVTGRTHKAMASKRPSNVEIETLNEIEQAMGYAKIKDRTLEILTDISKNKKLKADDVNDVTGELSGCIEDSPPAVIIAPINAMAPTSEYLQRHTVNVGLLNGLLGRWLGLDKNQIDKLILIGFLHDVGKALMPPAILNAARKLTKVEYEVIKLHPKRTYDLCAAFPEDVRNAAADHHERLDGSGYPKGLSGDGVSIAAQITAISDVYSAMVSRRVFQPPKSPLHVLSLFEKSLKSQLDCELSNVLRVNLPAELMDKPVLMSDGTIGILREVFSGDIEFPDVEISRRLVKTNDRLYCVSMYNDD
ncbi:MAG: HD domain-containing protein [Oscillospiraceae bacterium]|nr:HD domain-containing protein [Oscillospiraceae bacterium]